MEKISGKFQNCFYTFSIMKANRGNWKLHGDIYLDFDKKSHIEGGKYDFSDAIGHLENNYSSKKEAIEVGKKIVENYLRKKLD